MKKFSIVLAVMMVLMVLMSGSGWAEEETIIKGSVPKDRAVYSEYEKAKELYNEGKYHDAIDILEDYIKETPDPWGYWLLGYSHYKLGEHDIANKYFRQAFLVDPSFTPTPTIEKKKKAPYRDARPEGYPKGAKKPSPEDTKLRLDQGTAVIVEPETEKPAPVKPVTPTPAPEPETTTAEAPVPEPAQPQQPAKAAPAVDVPAPGEIPPPAIEESTAPTAAPHGEIAPAQPEQPAEPPPPPPVQSQQPVPPSKPAGKPVPFEPTPENLVAVISAMIFALAIGFVIVSLIIGVFIYLLAKKLEVRLPILGFVPGIQFWTLSSCAGMSTLMTILLFLLTFILSPVALGIIFMHVADRLGKNKVLGLLLGLFFPIVPLIWFAFASGGGGAGAGAAMGGMGEMPDLSGEPQVPDLDFDLEEDDSFGGGMPEEPFAEEPVSELPEMPELPEDEPSAGGASAPDEWSLPGDEDQGVDEWSLPQEEDEGDQSVDEWSLPQDENEEGAQIEPWSLDDEENQ